MKKLLEKIGSEDNLQFENLFYSTLINQLPYLIWIYELIDDDYKLIKWNKNQEIYTEYNAKELYHMNPLNFFDKKDKERVKNAIEEIFIKGKSNIFSDLLTKSGKLIPYYFEGYKFNIDNRQMFIGISVNVSERTRTRIKLNLLKNEKQSVIQEKTEIEEQLLNLKAQILQNNRIDNFIDRHIINILKSDDINSIKNELIGLKGIINTKQKSQETWESFNFILNNIHNDFLIKLKKEFPELTKDELKFCSYVKIHIPVSEIASILNISLEGIRKKKYRIRKKLDLKRNESLEIYISKL